jgi:hypothetical protein
MANKAITFNKVDILPSKATTRSSKVACTMLSNHKDITETEVGGTQVVR